MKKNLLIILAVGVIAFTAVMFIPSNRANSGEEEEAEEMVDDNNIPLEVSQIASVGLVTGQIEERILDQTLMANGRLVLRAQNVAEVASKVAGIVQKVLVVEGQKVAKGQVLAMVENPDIVVLQREYYQACKETEFAKAEMERQQFLQSQGAGLGKNLQQAQANYRIVQSKQTGIARQLQQFGVNPKSVSKGVFTTSFPLIAPIAGIVSEVTGSLGSYADMQTPIMKLRNNDAVQCDLTVFERDLPKVKVGAKVWITLTNQEGVRVEGVVSGINENFNEDSKGVLVHVKINPPREVRLFDGMYVTGLIAIGANKVQAVPSEAIVKEGNKAYIFAHKQKHSLHLKKTHHFSRHEVKVGAENNGYTQITMVHPMDMSLPIVVKNSFYLASMVGNHGEE